MFTCLSDVGGVLDLINIYFIQHGTESRILIETLFCQVIGQDIYCRCV